MKCSRFTQSFVKQYARQEYAALRQRILAPAGVQPEAVCLVAIQGSGALLGTLDVRPPACAAGRQTKGVPEVRCNFCRPQGLISHIPAQNPFPSFAPLTV